MGATANKQCTNNRNKYKLFDSTQNPLTQWGQQQTSSEPTTETSISFLTQHKTHSHNGGNSKQAVYQQQKQV